MEEEIEKISGIGTVTEAAEKAVDSEDSFTCMDIHLYYLSFFPCPLVTIHSMNNKYIIT